MKSSASHAWLQRDQHVVDITADQLADGPCPVVVAENPKWHRSFRVASKDAGDFRKYSSKYVATARDLYVTPLSKAEWRLERDGQLVSLYPSIGNWNYDCKSYYYIEENRIRWVQKISAHKIKRVQQRDAIDIQTMPDPGRSRRDGATSTTSRSNE